MKDIADAILRIVDDFSARRFLALLIITSLGVALLITYERLTSSFRLERITRAANAIVALQSVDTLALRRNPPLGAAFRQLSGDLQSASASQPVVPDLPAFRQRIASTDAKWKFAAAALPWLLFSLWALVDGVRGQDAALRAIRPCLVLAVCCGTVGLFMPTTGVWSRYVLTPLGLSVLGLLVATAIDPGIDHSAPKTIQPGSR